MSPQDMKNVAAIRQDLYSRTLDNLQPIGLYGARKPRTLQTEINFTCPRWENTRRAMFAIAENLMGSAGNW
jgi:hypothetical protein